MNLKQEDENGNAKFIKFPVRNGDVVISDPTNNELLGMRVLTQAEYDALGTKDPNTLYVIIEG